MNKRRIISLLIASSVILSLFAGCNKNENEPAATTPESSSAVTTPAAENTEAENTGSNTEAPADTTEAEQGGESSEDNTVNKIAEAIKAAYGESYLPDMPMDNEMINTLFGLEADSYTEAFAESPMISMHPDTLLIVKAAEGKAGDVKAKIDAYRQRLLDDTMQYPMNLPKIHASQVVQNGDYVAFIMLGAINENMDASEEEQAKFAEEQEKIGVDAFNKYFE